ncbi:MAG: hypothetical protein DI538_01120 [Azospira oryzae]|nr:MAG: hypothetical protein DI538_01120 [Azospira oryzae]
MQGFKKNSESMSRLIQPLFVLFFSLLLTGASAQKPVPELWGLHVHDEAHALQQATIDQLEKKLITYEDSTTNQVALLIVSTLDGESIEEYSLKVAEKWKLGQKNKDNGVLLLVAVDDHKMRIEVGQGLESVLTDAQSNRIIRNEIAPNFRKDDYDAGVIAGVDGILKSIKGEYTANDSNGEFSTGTRIIIGLGLLFFVGLFTIVSLVLVEGRTIWWIYLGLIPFYAAFFLSVGVVGGIIVLTIYLIGFPVAYKLIQKNRLNSLNDNTVSKTTQSHSSSNDNHSSNFSSSSSSSWSSSSSSGSGSSFSGGGGSFGGGGSSGSW